MTETPAKYEAEQRTEAWKLARLGMVTASRVADVMATTKNGDSASRKNYMAELLCERLTGIPTEGFTSAAMQRGTDLEPVARTEYEVTQGLLVQEAGFVLHPGIEGLGASPDGYVDDNGLIEIKCPNSSTHIDFLLSGAIPQRYVWQMLCQMACTGRQWCDYASYDDRLPERLRLKVVRLERDDGLIGEMTEKVALFLKELGGLEEKLK